MDPKEKKVKEEELNVEETHNPAEDQPQNEQAELRCVELLSVFPMPDGYISPHNLVL